MTLLILTAAVQHQQLSAKYSNVIYVGLPPHLHIAIQGGHVPIKDLGGVEGNKLHFNCTAKVTCIGERGVDEVSPLKQAAGFR